nr:MAG TPA: zinc-ribbon family protein [Caudoviricetes sp.]
MNTKNEVFEYLIDQLRQQVNKKDVTSFNVSVRISDLNEVKQVIHNLQQHIAGKAPTVCVNCGVTKPEECKHEWAIMPGLFLGEGNLDNVPGSELCCKCGEREWDVKGYKPKNDTQKCSHPEGRVDTNLGFCSKCGSYL